MVGQAAFEKVFIGLEVEVAVAAEIEHDGAGFAFAFGFFGFSDHLGDGVGGFGRGQDTFGFSEQHTGAEAFELLHGYCLDQAVFKQLAADNAGAVITQAPGMDGSGHEIVAQRVHLQQRGIAGGIAEIVA